MSDAARDLTDLAAWLREQLAGETADLRTVLRETAEAIREITVRMVADPAESERDPDNEEWLARQLALARSRPAGPDDQAAIRKLAALPDGTVSEAVGRWLREARAAGQA